MQTITRYAMILMLAIGSASCAAKHYDVAAWQQQNAPITKEPATAISAAERVAVIEKTRATLDLAAARELTLAAVEVYPQDAEILWRAARAESDELLLHAPVEKKERALSALSSLEYAKRAAAINPDKAIIQAELAYSLGITTHLEPMMKRSAHAREMADAIARALKLDPNCARAHATDAVMQYRLSTLPWIAKVMAVNRPDSSLEGAEKSIRLALAAENSNENNLYLARILAARKKNAEAHEVAQRAIDGPDKFPRDKEYRNDLLAFLEAHPAEAAK